MIKRRRPSAAKRLPMQDIDLETSPLELGMDPISASIQSQAHTRKLIVPTMVQEEPTELEENDVSQLKQQEQRQPRPREADPALPPRKRSCVEQVNETENSFRSKHLVDHLDKLILITNEPEAEAEADSNAESLPDPNQMEDDGSHSHSQELAEQPNGTEKALRSGLEDNFSDTLVLIAKEPEPEPDEPEDGPEQMSRLPQQHLVLPTRRSTSVRKRRAVSSAATPTAPPSITNNKFNYNHNDNNKNKNKNKNNSRYHFIFYFSYSSLPISFHCFFLFIATIVISCLALWFHSCKLMLHFKINFSNNNSSNSNNKTSLLQATKPCSRRSVSQSTWAYGLASATQRLPSKEQQVGHFV